MVVSFEMKCRIKRPIDVYAYQSNGISITDRKKFTVNVVNEYQRFTFITKANQLGNNPSYSKWAIAFYDGEGNQNISIRKVFIGIGNKFGGYVMNNEDTQVEINQAKEKAQKALTQLLQKQSEINHAKNTAISAKALIV